MALVQAASVVVLGLLAEAGVFLVATAAVLVPLLLARVSVTAALEAYPGGA